MVEKGKGEGEDPGKFMKRTLILILGVLLLNCGAEAVNLEPGYFSDSKIASGTLSLDGDYSATDATYGILLNANLSNRNYGLESLVVKYVEYDNGKLGISYSPIENLSFGHGLLLNDLSTAYYQPAFSANKQRGLKVDYDLGGIVVEGVGTYSHLYGISLKDISLFNMNFGLEYLSDARMVSAEGYGRSACGAYVELPLTEEFGLFAEEASTSNGGEGALAGVSLDYDLIFAFSKITLAGASFNDRFIPGYFTSGYDLDPVDFVSLESKTGRRYGTIVSLNTGILGVIELKYKNESYTDGGCANSGSFLISPFSGLNITGFVKELSFLDYRAVKGVDSDLVGGSIECDMGGGMNASLNYKKALTGEDLNLTDDLLKPYETYYFKLGYEF
jgi:hypothetical protein